MPLCAFLTKIALWLSLYCFFLFRRFLYLAQATQQSKARSTTELWRWRQAFCFLHSIFTENIYSLSCLYSLGLPYTRLRRSRFLCFTTHTPLGLFIKRVSIVRYFSHLPQYF